VAATLPSTPSHSIFAIKPSSIPSGGASDLRAKLIRACSDTSLKDDPIRILRAVRQAAALDFKIEPETRKAMKQATSLLPNILLNASVMSCLRFSKVRVPMRLCGALEMLGVFPYLLPELTTMKGVEQSAPHVHDVWEHTLSVMQNLESILSALAPSYDAEKTNDLFSGLLTLRLGPYREQFAAHFNQSLNADRSMRACCFSRRCIMIYRNRATKSVEETGRDSILWS